MCSNGKCTNMDGSFNCECLDGFKLSGSGLSCVDVDECLENPLICLKGQCRNAPGSYFCICEDGFVLSTDQSFCRDLNECRESGMCENGRCINMDGSFKCICDPGYHLATNGKTCRDIDECASNPCLGGTCTNTDNGAKDDWDDGCAQYEDNLHWCGNYNNEVFQSDAMCCACGGGNIGGNKQ